MSHKIVRFILVLVAVISSILLLVAATRFINLPTPFDVVCIIIPFTWLIPRMRRIYLRGLLVVTKIITATAIDVRHVGIGVILFSNDAYSGSERIRRFIERCEREEKE
ncbi:MAG: hypothetical protein WC575_01390 [Patescibacteria group bacterium]